MVWSLLCSQLAIVRRPEVPVHLLCQLHADAIIFLGSLVVNMEAQRTFLFLRKETLSERQNAISCLSRHIITRACTAVRPRERGIPRRPPCLYSRLNIYRLGRLRGAAAAPPVRSNGKKHWPGEQRHKEIHAQFCMHRHMHGSCAQLVRRKEIRKLVTGKNPRNPNTNVQMVLFCG